MNNSILEIAVKAANDKLAKDIVVLDMNGISPIVDYFVICHGNNERQINAVVREIKDKITENKYEVKRIEGQNSAKWVLIDLGDVVVHVFEEEERYNYHLEKLWGDVARLDISEWI